MSGDSRGRRTKRGETSEIIKSIGKGEKLGFQGKLWIKRVV